MHIHNGQQGDIGNFTQNASGKNENWFLLKLL